MQTTGVTSKMETRYLKPISTVDGQIVLRARIQEKKKNVVLLEASISNQQNERCTTAICTYFTFSQEKAKSEMHFSGCSVADEEVNPLV